jgi:thiamine-phosphate pyrophosphorylase
MQTLYFISSLLSTHFNPKGPRLPIVFNPPACYDTDLQGKVDLTLKGRKKVPEPKKIRGLYTIIDTSYVPPEGIERAAVDITAGGARIIQLRAKGIGSGESLKTARLLKEVTSKRKVTFIVNDRVDIALLSRADGVHLGQVDIPVKEARRLLGKEKIIGLSTHNLNEALAADRSGYVDYISFGPIFPTISKTDALTPKGLKGLLEVRRNVTLPVTAIGGITEDNLSSVLKQGPDAVAMISEILTSKDIRKKVAVLVEKIETFSKRADP